MHKITLLLIIITTLTIKAQTVFGEWKNTNEDTGDVSIVKVYKKDGKAYAKIIELSASNKGAVCEKCTDYRKNHPIEGMEILSGLKQDGDEWNEGEILDPESGKIYACYIKLVNANKLKVKGHLKGFSFLGKTVYWMRRVAN